MEAAVLGVDGLPVDDGGDLPVGAAGVKADAAAVQVAADGLGLLVGGGEVLLGAEHDLEAPLEDVVHKVPVEVPDAAGHIGLLQLFRGLLAAADGDPPAAHAPEQELDGALHEAVVGLGKALVPEEGLKDGNAPVVPLHGHLEGPAGFTQKGVRPDGEGDEARLQGGLVGIVVFDTQIIHWLSSQFEQNRRRKDLRPGNRIAQFRPPDKGSL